MPLLLGEGFEKAEERPSCAEEANACIHDLVE